MTPNSYNVAVMIGQFQPFHLGHLCVLEEALRLGDVVLILCEAVEKPRTVHHPWTFEERKAMIMEAAPPDARTRIFIAGIHEYLYDEAHCLQEIKTTVDTMLRIQKINTSNIILLTQLARHVQDVTHPLAAWRLHPVLPLPNIRSMDIRRRYFTGKPIASFVSPSIAEWLHHFRGADDMLWMHFFQGTDDYVRLASEWDALLSHHYSLGDVPLDATENIPIEKNLPLWVTAYMVVMHRENILMLERKYPPGEGLYALPGGSVQADEWVLDSAIRHLREATGLEISQVERREVRESYQLFDAPQRAITGRVVAITFCWKPLSLPSSLHLGADVGQLLWIPAQSVRSDRVFEDHDEMIQRFCPVNGVQ